MLALLEEMGLGPEGAVPGHMRGYLCPVWTKGTFRVNGSRANQSSFSSASPHSSARAPDRFWKGGPCVPPSFCFQEPLRYFPRLLFKAEDYTEQKR